MMITTRFCPVCGAANELARTHCFACEQLLVASIDDRDAKHATLLRERYQLGALLGSGGFSVVYHARDMQADGRDVAIKQINLQGLKPEEMIETTDTFNREVSLLSILHHPQIPWLYDHFDDRDHWYLVLEYLEGDTLEVYLEKRIAQGKPIQIDEALSMALQLCVVLEYLHTRQPPIIFRDLKPGNIIRTPGGKLCLIDFGIARRFRPGQVRDTQRLGSPGYAAPEQYGRSQTTTQADIYSLGALLYALISGQDPSEQPQGLAPLHLNGYAGEADLSALVQRMLSSNPVERPATAREVAVILEQVQQKRRASHDMGRIWVPPVPQMYPSYMGNQQQMYDLTGQGTRPAAKPRTGRRNVLIGIGALAAVSISGPLIWQMSQIQPPAPTLPQPVPTPQQPANSLYIYVGQTDSVWNVVWSSSGSRVASCSVDKTVQIWDALDGGNVFTYRGHTSAVNDALWSPDGKRIASASNDKTVQIWNASDGSSPLIYRGHADDVQEANWSPNGKHIVSCSLDTTVQIWNPKTGILINTYQEHNKGVLAAKWSPDGKRIASSSEDATAHIWDATTLNTTLIYNGHKSGVNEVAWSPDGKRVASASEDGTAQVWNAADGSNALMYTGHTDTVNTVAWSPDGKFIASGSGDTTVQIWDASSGNHIFTYTGHSEPVIGTGWSPDGKLLASASEDHTVQIWQIP
ncbi:MAG TPA: protein kinase [Ktedonobacteraceae bacterium]